MANIGYMKMCLMSTYGACRTEEFLVHGYSSHGLGRWLESGLAEFGFLLIYRTKVSGMTSR